MHADRALFLTVAVECDSRLSWVIRVVCRDVQHRLVDFVPQVEGLGGQDVVSYDDKLLYAYRAAVVLLHPGLFRLRLSPRGHP
eukprot:scaffold81713_cov43-Prasinocladus_malaysianus.AAC.1